VRYKTLPACWAEIESRLTVGADVMSVQTLDDWGEHYFKANWTLQETRQTLTQV